MLGHLRGDTALSPAPPDSPAPPPEERQSCILPFTQLRKLAQENALQIQPPGSPYVGPDELQLLAWVARAQRYKTYNENFHHDERLTRSIFLCAGILTGLGISLPPVTMLTRTGRPKAKDDPA
ncbi:MAG: hypothetical protein AB7E05_15780 [Sphingobium sp.]